MSKRGVKRFLIELAAVMIVAAIVAVSLMLTSCEAPEPRAVRERICFICRTADNQIRNGYDLIFYSDDGSTETATLSGDSGNLSLDGTLTTAGAQTVNNDLTITGTLYSNVEILTIGDSAIITGTLMSDGETLTIGDSAAVTGTLAVTGRTNVADIRASTTLGVEGNTTMTGTLDVDGNTDLDDVQVSGELEVTGASIMTGTISMGSMIYGSTWITPTSMDGGEHFTPTTTSLYVVDSTGAVSMTLGACSSTGRLLWTYGDDNNNVTINDTNVRTNDGSAQVMGQYDLITWMCIGTTWVEVSESNNS